MPQFDSEGIPNQVPETNKPNILNGPTSRNREGSDQSTPCLPGRRTRAATTPSASLISREQRSSNILSKYPVRNSFDNDLHSSGFQEPHISRQEGRPLRNRLWVPSLSQYLCQDSFLKTTSEGASTPYKGCRNGSCAAWSPSRYELKVGDVGGHWKEKKELVGSLAEKKLPIEGRTGRNGEREKSSGQKKISNNKICVSCAGTKRKAESRKDWRILGLQ
ncbi:hypothetical protein ANN_11285 [Periplaneta americana]|uniref:Uncharacterized protein n=1 Tax=Periplaneta americana TaxID=6978 RepID=A0ABQ8T4K8_PERAM|nr:hypothetical protein ANN_11285 [Periplaneta americana]